MECKIVKKATEMFLNLGFKSVTMDDIAQESGMSKKTIYQYFKNKTALVQSCVNDFMQRVGENIVCVKSKELNAVEELLEVKKVIVETLKNEKSSPDFQLQKYYPQIYQNVKQRHFELMSTCVSDNLKRGIDAGLYRPEINVDILTKMHFACSLELKNVHIFPPEIYPMKQLMSIYLENFLRSIVTPKGLEILEQQLKKQ